MSNIRLHLIILNNKNMNMQWKHPKQWIQSWWEDFLFSLNYQAHSIVFLKKKVGEGGKNIFENYAAETIKCNLGKIFAARKKGPPPYIYAVQLVPSPSIYAMWLIMGIIMPYFSTEYLLINCQTINENILTYFSTCT